VQAHFQDWLGLLLRWAHLITGVAWIGASFYFNWLENRLQRQDQPPGVAGDLWAVHGGGFYYLRKLAVAPEELPAELHWFKWEAYATWLTGIALMGVVYYWNAAAFLLAPGSALAAGAGIAVGLASLAVSWLVYDLLCRALAERRPGPLAIALVAWFTLLAWALPHWLSARASWLHVGAAIGTVMVANVWLVIIPAQRELVAAVREMRPPDPAPGRKALTRSRHNNYLTLPVLFMMISTHYPGTYGHAHAWAVLLGIALAGVAVRHWFNIRHRAKLTLPWLLAGLALLLAVALYTAPRQGGTPAGALASSTAEVLPIVRQRCAGCHARQPTQPGIAAPPLGIILESAADLELHRQRIVQTVAAGVMPLGNLTGMTDAERETVVNWRVDQ